MSTENDAATRTPTTTTTTTTTATTTSNDGGKGAASSNGADVALAASSSSQVSAERPETPDVRGTVFADPSDFSIKHPLQAKWTLWFDNPPKKASKENWGEALKPLSTFDTVEDFWAVFNNVRPASALSPGSNFHLFRDGIRPEWEDPANGQGGKWVASFARSQKSTLDRTWLYLILAVIGEQFRDSEEICGCVVSIRAQACRIAMWVRSADRNAFMSIGNQIKLILGLPPKKLEFTTHSAAMKKNSSKSSATAVI